MVGNLAMKAFLIYNSCLYAGLAVNTETAVVNYLRVFIVGLCVLEFGVRTVRISHARSMRSSNHVL